MISAFFITAWWLFGILIPFSLLVFQKTLSGMNAPSLGRNARHFIFISTFSLFTVTFLLFSVPSFAANYFQMPNNSYDQTPPKIYSLYGGNLDVANREHIYAQSWFDYRNQVNDLHNVIWSDPITNSLRADKEFGSAQYQYEPQDRYKGDIARALLYMYVTYGDLAGFDKTKIDINLMKDWSKMDAVSQDERLLNEWIKINSIQHNSNKFIDYPYLVGFVVP